MSCGSRLKQVREIMGFTQAGLGEKLGFKWTKIKDIEIGKQKLTPEIALDIEQKFSFSFRWLLTGQGDMTAGVAGLNEDYAKKSPIVGRIELMLADMNEEAQRDVLKYAEEKKQLAELIKERANKKARKAG